MTMTATERDDKVAAAAQSAAKAFVLIEDATKSLAEIDLRTLPVERRANIKQARECLVTARKALNAK